MTMKVQKNEGLPSHWKTLQLQSDALNPSSFPVRQSSCAIPSVINTLNFVVST